MISAKGIITYRSLLRSEYFECFVIHAFELPIAASADVHHQRPERRHALHESDRTDYDQLQLGPTPFTTTAIQTA